MSKRKFWSAKNVLTTLKAIVASIVVGAVGLIPAGIGYALARFTNLGMISYVISGFLMVFSLWFWGYLVNLWWNWE